MEIIKKIGAVLLIGFGMMMIAGMIINQGNGKSENSLVADLALAGIFGAVPITLGIWIIRNDIHKKKQSLNNQTEVALLRKAQSQDGHITIAEAALTLAVSVTEAKTALDKMQSNGIFEIAITDDGTLIYQISQSIDHTKMKNGTNFV